MFRFSSLHGFTGSPPKQTKDVKFIEDEVIDGITYARIPRNELARHIQLQVDMEVNRETQETCVDWNILFSFVIFTIVLMTFTLGVFFAKGV